MATAYSGPTPKHLWIVGILSLLWNCFGGYEYIMAQTGNGLSADELAWTRALPSWSIACWAIGVWGSVLGSILLLARSRFAAPVFLVSLLGAVASFAYQFSPEAPASIHGGMAAIAPVIITIAIVLQWYYARRMTAVGALR